MKSIAAPLLVGIVLLTSACTSLQPQEAPPEEIQRLIVTEGLLVPGEKVRIVTADDAVHKFRIVSVDLENAVVNGRDNSVPFAEIVAVETREFAIGKTTALALGAPSGFLILLFLAAGATF